MKKIIILFSLIIMGINSTFAQNNSNEIPVCQEIYRKDLGIKNVNDYYHLTYDIYNNYLYVKDYSDGKKSIIYNGVESKKYDNIGLYVFSEKGNNYAYTVAVDGKWIVIKNGEIFDKNSINVRLLTFSEDGNSFTYATEIDKKWYVVKDGEMVSKGYTWINYIIYSDKNNVLYDGVSDKNISMPSKDSMVNPKAEGAGLPNSSESDIYINSTKIEDYKGDDIFHQTSDLHLDSGYYKVINGKLQKVKNQLYFGYYENTSFIDFSSIKYYSNDSFKNTYFDFILDKTYFYENDKLFNTLDNTNSVRYIGYFLNNKNIYYVTYLNKEVIEYQDTEESHLYPYSNNITYVSGLKNLYINDKKVYDFNYIYNIRNTGLNKIEVLAISSDNKDLVKVECDTSKFNYGESKYIGNYETYNKAKLTFDSLTKKIESKTNGIKSKKIEIYKNIIEKLKPLSLKSELNGYIYRFFVDKLSELNK